MSVETIWLIVGLLGQGIFSARFIVQWLVSEKEKRSVIPVVFWYLSLLGGITLLFYSIYKHDPVFILGQSTGVLIYSRNLFLIQRERLAHQDKVTINGLDRRSDHRIPAASTAGPMDPATKLDPGLRREFDGSGSGRNGGQGPINL